MHRTAITRFGAALSLGLLWSALSGGTIVAAASPAPKVGVVRSDLCLRAAACVQENTDTVLTSSVSPSVFGQSVTFTATVTPLVNNGLHPAFPVPPVTGTVDFSNNGKPLCTGAALTSGVATCTKSGMVVGDHVIGADYNGDDNYNTSSDTLDQAVNKAGTRSIISSSSRTSDFGQAVTLGVYVFTAKPGGGIPTGTFQFKIDGVKFGSPVALGADGRAFLPPMSDLSVGPHLVGGKYSGDSNHRQSTPVRLLQFVLFASPH